jgi:hypothetical protein
MRSQARTTQHIVESLDDFDCLSIPDALAALAIRQVVASEDAVDNEFEMITRIPNHNTPLLRAQYEHLLFQISGERLKHRDWVDTVLNCRDLEMLMTGWRRPPKESDAIACISTSFANMQKRTTLLLGGRPKAHDLPAPLACIPDQKWTLQTVCEPSQGSHQEDTSLVSEMNSSVVMHDASLSVSFLSRQLKKKHDKWRQQQQRGFNNMALVSPQTVWCRCTIS